MVCCEGIHTGGAAWAVLMCWLQSVHVQSVGMYLVGMYLVGMYQVQEASSRVLENDVGALLVGEYKCRPWVLQWQQTMCGCTCKQACGPVAMMWSV
jgi:hypothetical protein